MADADKKKHDHLEIHALVDGGYVVREGRFDGGVRDKSDEAVWNWRQERAAFTTLGEAVGWMARNMMNKSPSMVVSDEATWNAARAAAMKIPGDLELRAALHNALTLYERGEILATSRDGALARWVDETRTLLALYSKG